MRRFLLILAVLMVLLLAAGVGYLWLTARLTGPGAVPVPTALAGQRPAAVAYGAEAVAEVTRLHGLDFPLTGGGFAVYGERGQAIVWVAGTPLAPMAARLVAAMDAKIAEGNSPFTPMAQREVDGRIIYELEGMGQKHFYFQAGRSVVWLAADPDLAEQALQDALAFYQ